jgi:hypothetical protein
MADYAQASGRHMELGQARRQVEAQKQAMAQMQSQLQQKDIDLQARLRELIARERALEKREAERQKCDAERAKHDADARAQREKHEADARALSRSQSLELHAAEDRLRILEAQVDARQAALVVYILPCVGVPLVSICLSVSRARVHRMPSTTRAQDVLHWHEPFRNGVSNGLPFLLARRWPPACKVPGDAASHLRRFKWQTLLFVLL